VNVKQIAGNCFEKRWVFSRSYCNTVWSAIDIILSSVSALSVCLWRCALWLSWLYQRVPSRRVPICPFRHFCCRM